MDETRREFLSSLAKWTVGSAAAVTMAGCGEIVEQIAASCPTSSPDPIDWFPDVAHPVFWGFTDVDASSGAPGPARIWYPTLERAPREAPMLKMCVARSPLVLFLHGQPPEECRTFPEYHEWWEPISLARSGYVVVVPQLQLERLPGDPGSPNLALALRFLDWARSGWEHSTWVSRDVTETALVGHSYGVPVAVQVAGQRPAGALVALSGAWEEVSLDQIARLTMPSMLMWGDAENQISLPTGGKWEALPWPKYSLTFSGGQHFDYLADLLRCDEPRGSCPPMDRIAMDLSALFVARHVPVPLSRSRVEEDMTLAPYELTAEQESYAESHLALLRALERNPIPGCSIDMRWEPSESVENSRRIG